MATRNSPRTPRTRTPSRDLEAALTDAAEAVLVREGPGAVTVRAVAAEAGVAPMGVYNRFGSKDGLIDALLIRGFQGLTAAISTRDDEPDPISRFWRVGMRYREFALNNRSHYTLMFGDPGEGARESSAELSQCADSAFGVLVDHVSTTIAAGRFRPDDPRDMAQQIWSAVHGAVLLEMTGRVLTGDPELVHRHLLSSLVRAFALPGAVGFPDPDGPPVSSAAARANGFQS